jgi:hypothetical protein
MIRTTTSADGVRLVVALAEARCSLRYVIVSKVMGECWLVSYTL